MTAFNNSFVKLYLQAVIEIWIPADSRSCQSHRVLKLTGLLRTMSREKYDIGAFVINNWTPAGTSVSGSSGPHTKMTCGTG